MIIRKPITTPGKASGKVNIDNTISLPGKIFLTRKSPAVVEIISAENVTAIESSKVANKLSKCLGLLIIEKYDDTPISPLPPIIANCTIGTIKKVTKKIVTGRARTKSLG
jgi:hypothetical protein